MVTSCTFDSASDHVAADPNWNEVETLVVQYVDGKAPHREMNPAADGPLHALPAEENVHQCERAVIRPDSRLYDLYRVGLWCRGVMNMPFRCVELLRREQLALMSGTEMEITQYSTCLIDRRSRLW
jgi:hypothetical protein